MLRAIQVVLVTAIASLCLVLPRLAVAEGEDSAAPEAAPPVAAPGSAQAAAPEAGLKVAVEAEAEAEADKKEKEDAPEEGAADTTGATAAGASGEGLSPAPVSVETVDATPAETSGEAEEDAEEAITPAAKILAMKSWSATISHSFGWGLQADDTTGYTNGTLSASGSYTLARHVSASASLGMRYTLDKTPNDSVRLDLGAISLSVNHASLYRDRKYTGVNLTGGVTVSQSLGMGTVRIGRAPTVGVRVGAMRKVGPVGLSYGLGFNRFFPVDAAPRSSACAADRGSETLCLGGYASAWAISNSIAANYSPVNELSLTAAFVWNAARSFGPNKPDQYSSNLNPALNNRRENFGFSFSGTWTTPIDGLSAGLSFSNARPWRTEGQTLALVDFSYGVGMIFDARYAAMSLDLSYSF